jgi:Fanconi anemia group J protein
MGSFASELGVQFEACLEAPHVINVESQVCLMLACSAVSYILNS